LRRALACRSCLAGAHHHFVIAFDLDRSIVDEGGELRLKPVLRLALAD
jgi:hypothetical protein